MTWKARKYREISEFFARFTILTMFLLIELLSYFKLGNYQKHHKTQLLGEFCEITMSQTEDMSLKTRKYREISQIFVRFAILTMFLLIKLL